MRQLGCDESYRLGVRLERSFRYNFGDKDVSFHLRNSSGQPFEILGGMVLIYDNHPSNGKRRLIVHVQVLDWDNVEKIEELIRSAYVEHLIVGKFTLANWETE